MSRLTSFASAFEAFTADIQPLIVKQYGSDDITALREAWNDYTDMLCKDGAFNALMYHHCPSVDDDMPETSDTAEFMLDAMGFEFDATQLPARTDRSASEWDKDATHWRVRFQRNGATFVTEYSMGSAHGGEPQAHDVMESLLQDMDSVDGYSFEEWADSIGADSDSRKAEATYNACRKIYAELSPMISGNERSDMQEIFSDLY